MVKVLCMVCLLLFAVFALAFLSPSWEPPERDVVRVVSHGPYVLTWGSGEEERHRETTEGRERYTDHEMPAGEAPGSRASVTIAKDGWDDGTIYAVLFRNGEYAECGSTGDSGYRASEVTLRYESFGSPGAREAVCSTYRFWSWFG